MKSEKSRYHVPNLERALKIFEFLARNSGKATKAEIARELGFPGNSVFRIVSTLENEGYLTRDPDNNEYSISRKLLSLGYQALVETNLLELAVDILRKLRDETRETALIGTLLTGEGVVIEQEFSPEPIKFTVSPGTSFQLHTAAPGKAIMACLGENEREDQISRMKFTRFNSNTICTADKYREELALVKQQGYALDLEEETEGIICIAAPVFDYRGYPKASVWVTGPSARLARVKIPKVAEVVKKHAAALSARLGFHKE